MKLTRCSSGHFYDADKYSECPQCSDSTVPVSTPVGMGEDVTVPLAKAKNTDFLNDDEGVTLPLTMPSEYPDNDSDVTVSIYPTVVEPSPTGEKATTPAVGWLVCVGGKYIGCDFRLQVGRNTIGRESKNSICLSGDKSVSREPQVIVVYEPMTNRFFVLPGTAKELAYVNNDVLLEREDLHKNDIIELGETKLMLIPCCDERFNWNDILKK